MKQVTPAYAGDKPEAIDEIDRRIVQMKIEREALSKEKDRPQKTVGRWTKS